MDAPKLRTSFGSRYRYHFVEADGTEIGFGAIQRPAAERKASRQGLGLWDTRENEYVLLPDLDKRLDHWLRQCNHFKAKLEEAEEKRDACWILLSQAGGISNG